MADIIVSIIVPVYKTEQYLERCVSSLIHQTIQEIEIILVDDGSPDNSGILCDQFAEMDSRIKVIHKANGGLSSARNAGMAAAKGRYIGFVDSDDDIELDMYRKMSSIADTNQVDFVMSDYLRIQANGKKYVKTLDIDCGLYSKEKIRQCIFPSLIMGENLDYGPLLSVWHCLYRRDFLDTNGLRFEDDIRWSEDNIFSAITGYHANSFYYMKGIPLYHYYQNADTITTSYKRGAWKVYCRMNDRLHQFFDTIKEYDFSRQLKLHMIYYACNCVGQEMSGNRKTALENIKTILNDPHLRNAFSGFAYPKVSLKLTVQLFLMKHRLTRLLYYLKH